MEKEEINKAFGKIMKMFKVENIVSEEQLQKVLTGIFDLLTQFKKENSQLNKDTQTIVDELLIALLDKHEKWEKSIENKGEKHIDSLKKGIEEIKYLINEFKKIKPKDGDTPDKDEIIEEILERLQSDSEIKEKVTENTSEEITGETIIDKINDLPYEEDNLIDPRRIAGWEDMQKNSSDSNVGRNYGGIRAIANAMDVDFAGIEDGQVIAWNSSRNLFEAVDQTGGGGGSSTLADVSSLSTDATKSTYTMTDTVDVVFNDAGGNAVFTIDETNRRIIVGATATDVTAISSSIALVKNGIAFMQAFGYGASGSNGGFFTGYAATGTAGSPGAVTSGSTLAALSGRGYDGTAWSSGSQASILLRASELWTNTARGTEIVFNTTPNTTTTNTACVVIGNQGNMVVGFTAVQNARLGVVATRSASYFSSGGVALTVYDSTFTDTSSSGTVATARANVFGTQTFAASSATTYTNASTLYIGGAPTAGSNVTFTNSWSLYVASGQVGFGGAISPLSSGGTTLGTSSLPWGASYLGTIELGNASDTTISRASAGRIAVEGVNVMTISSTDTVTNKSIDGSTNTITNLTLAMFATNVIDTDTSLAANSDSRVATQKAVKAYIDASVTGLLDLKGSTDTSANPNYPSALKGDAYYVTVAGKIGGASGKSVDIGDVYVALADNAGGNEATVGTSWFVLEHNLAGVAVTSGTLAQFAATTSAQLAGVISDETGSGALVFANTPTLVTPVLGVATATSINGLTITSSTGTLTITNSKVFSVSNTLTFTGTDGSSVAFGAGGTVAYTANNLGVFAASTSAAIGVGTIELGHASDTTLARSSAGVVTIEGVVIDTVSGTNTLSNKTLTAPKFASGGFIADANGNEAIIFTTTASAVNEFTFTNAATGTSPSIAATGGDTNIDIIFTPKGTGIVKGTYHRFQVTLVDSTTDVATGTAIGGDFRISKYAITVKAVGAYVDTAGTTGLMTIDINEAGTTIMSSNKITLDSTEKSSETAATAPGITDSAIAADAIVTIDVDGVQTTKAKGLKVWIDYVYA